MSDSTTQERVDHVDDRQRLADLLLYKLWGHCHPHMREAERYFERFPAILEQAREDDGRWSYDSAWAAFDALPDTPECTCPAGAPPLNWSGCPIHGHAGPTPELEGEGRSQHSVLVELAEEFEWRAGEYKSMVGRGGIPNDLAAWERGQASYEDAANLVRELSGEAWIEAATVEVVELPPADSDVVGAVADVLHGIVALDDEDQRPAPREHYLDLARDVLAAAPFIAAKAVEEKDREIKALDEARFAAESSEEKLHDRVLVAEKRAEKAERERDSLSESYERMKRARTEALRERDQAIERVRERALAKSDEFIAAYWGTGAEPTETFRVSVREALATWLDTIVNGDDHD